MSIYLPLGIALYHASNSQLVYIAGMQKRYARVDNSGQHTKATSQLGSRLRKLKLKSYNPANRTMLLIGVGMVLQVSLIFHTMTSDYRQLSSSAPSWSSCSRESSTRISASLENQSPWENAAEAGNGEILTLISIFR